MSSRENKRAYVYIVECADGSYYTGLVHISVEKRVAEHNLGVYAGYTMSRRPVRLRYSEEFTQITDAIAFERRVKGWSRAKKEALIRRDWEALRRLSCSRPSPKS
jgi:putative endonuclease